MNPTPLDPNWTWGPLDELTHRFMGTMVIDGKIEFGGIAVLVYLFYLGKTGFRGGTLAFLFEFGIRYSVIWNLLVYYDKPCPWLNDYSVQQVLPVIANYYANMIGLARLDIFYAHLVELYKSLAANSFSIQNWSLWFAATSVEVLCWVIQGVLCALNVPAYIFLAVTTLLGPIMIPWALWPRMSHLAWNALESALQYSFYRVAAAAVIFVFSTSLNAFMDTMIMGDMSLVNLSSLAGYFIAILIAIPFTCWGVPRFVSGLFKGTSDAAGGFAAVFMRRTVTA